MILLTLSRGNEHERVHLRLPASPAEIGEAFVILDGISLDTTTTAILDVRGNVPGLYRYSFIESISLWPRSCWISSKDTSFWSSLVPNVRRSA